MEEKSRIEIRSMQPADVARVAEIERECFSEPWTETGFAEGISQEQNLFLVAEENGEIVGYVGMYVAIDEGEITNVAVTSNARRKGVADQLLQKLLAKSQAAGVLRIVLEVRSSNEGAIRLYETKGFSNVGIRKGFYSMPKEDAVIMVLELDAS